MGPSFAGDDGATQPAPDGSGQALSAYLRDDVLVALNLSGEPQSVPLGDLAGRARLTTRLDGREEEVRGELHLRADEGVVICLCNA